MPTVALDLLRFPEAPFSPNGYDGINDRYLLWAYHGKIRARCTIEDLVFEDCLHNEDAENPSAQAIEIIKRKFQQLAVSRPDLLNIVNADGFIDLRLNRDLFEIL